MFPITLSKPFVAIPAIALLAIACIEITLAATQFTAFSVGAIHGFLSNLRHLGEPGPGSVVFVPSVLLLSAVMGGHAGSMGISGARWRSSPSRPRG